MFRGVIIEESLESKDVLNLFPILQTEVEQVTERFGTPWLTEWHLHTIEVPDTQIAEFAKAVQLAIESAHQTSWYADFKTDTVHYIIFKNKIFVIDRTKREEYQAAQDYGISLGVPPHQVNFTTNVVNV
ncbi:MAG: hypothetical protein AAB573_04605 [Patescibacteria group bacterium]